MLKKGPTAPLSQCAMNLAVAEGVIPRSPCAGVRA